MKDKSLIADRWDKRLRKVVPRVDLTQMEQVFLHAEKEKRTSLFEHEVYNLLAALGSETPPKAIMLPPHSAPDDDTLLSIPGETVVLKIVSPTIVHKSDVHGVRIVPKSPEAIRAAWRRMLYEVPENYARLIEQNKAIIPEAYEGLTGEALMTAISLDIAGILLVQHMHLDTTAFGNELIVGLRNTREFGMVLSAGLGGTDTELYAEHFRKDRAIVSAATANMDGLDFFQLFSRTVSYKKLAGLTRSQTRIVSDEQLVECFSALITVANHFSPENPETSFIIEEMEVNPFAIMDYRMVPLDGLCHFSQAHTTCNPRPVEKITALLHPNSIGIIGVSPSRNNFGRIILNNIIKEGFSPEHITIIHPEAQTIDGVRCITGMHQLTKKVDMFVVAVGAESVPELVDQIITLDAAHSVLLIPGGLGETASSRQRAENIISRINEAHATECTGGPGGPVFCGGNSMGIISHPGKYDTWFLSEEKLPKQRNVKQRNLAFISQSGAFMGTRMSQCPSLDPAYLISVGNQTDLTLGDFMTYFQDHPHVDVLGVYAEGFNDRDGLTFANAVRQAVHNGKEVIFYKAGRTPEGQLATSGHTASLAGDYTVCEACLTQAGAIVAKNIGQFEDLLLLASRLHNKSIRGNRIAGVSSAGFEAVGIADYLQTDSYTIRLAELSAHSMKKIQKCITLKGLDTLVQITNPLDITPGADDEVFASILHILDAEKQVDAIVVGLVPITPEMYSVVSPSTPVQTGIIEHIRNLQKTLTTPLVIIVDGGSLFDPFVHHLEALDIPVFRCVDRAMESLSTYITGRLSCALLQR